jgi:hypothetical protein
MSARQKNWFVTIEVALAERAEHPFTRKLRKSRFSPVR